MNLTDEIRKLAELHQEGHLTAAEFAEAKRKLIYENRPDSAPEQNDEKSVSSTVAPIVEKCFQSSRWSAGNLFFPDRLTLASDGMLFRKRSLFGSNEEHINYKSVSSFRVKNGFFLANISIETSGGSQPIFVNGIWKSQAKDIQETIRTFQRQDEK